jgi:WD40 repeat protein
MRSLLESLSRQITRIYGEDDSNIPTEYNDLVQDFKDRLDFAKSEKPLFIFLDALDQLSDSDSAHNLTWLPDDLPENVHIVISTLKNIFQSSLNHKSAENTVEVLSLEKKDGKYILDAWFNDNERKLTDEQENEIISKFEMKGLPLYLKLASEESKLWKSYTPIPKFQSDIKWMINNLFERLSHPENHGEMLVSRSLGYLSAAKNGLTEDEMLDILASDEDVFNLTKKFHKPTENKLPVALWSRLYFDLEPYLTEKSADETSLLAFYHKQLGEVARAKYLDNSVKKSRHQIIAEYFYKQDLYFDQNEERFYNVRKVSELPYHETCAESWDNLEETLTDLYFVEAKCAVGKTYELIEDYKLALDMHPDAQEEKQKRLEHEERVEKYVKDLIAYSKGEIDNLDIIPSVKPWTDEEIIEDSERIINNPTSLDRIKAFSQFVNSQSRALTEFGHMSGFCLQEAYNFANSGPLSENARKIKNKETHKPLILKDEKWLPEYNPHPALIKTLEGHTKIVTVAVTPDGKTAITGNWDGTMRVWDLETGKNLKTLLAHIDAVWALAVTPDGKTAITGDSDGVMRVWDLEIGEVRETLEGHKFMVTAVAVTPDGKTAITGSWDGTAKVWGLETGGNLKRLLNHTRDVLALAVTPDGKTAITGDSDGVMSVWDLEIGEVRETLEGHTKSLTAVAVTPDGKTAITGSWDGTAKVWGLETGGNLKRLLNHTRDVLAVAVTPDGKTVITGSTDRTMRVWDLETSEIISVSKEDASVKCLTITIDGSFVSGYINGDVFYSHLVNLPVEFPLITARRIWLYGRNGDMGFWDDNIEADCQWCGNRFKVADDIINTIKKIEKKYKKSNGWIADEAWEDPRLISECPECHKEFKFNPFIVDNKPKKSRWKFWKN